MFCWCKINLQVSNQNKNSNHKGEKWVEREFPHEVGKFPFRIGRAKHDRLWAHCCCWNFSYEIYFKVTLNLNTSNPKK